MSAPKKPPLHVAAIAGDVAAIKQALDGGAAIDERDEDEQTAALLATRRGYVGAVAALLDAGADPLAHGGFVQGGLRDLPWDEGRAWTLLHEAVRSGDLDVVKLLLARGFAVDALDRNALSPLSHAMHADAIDVGRLLLDGGAAPGGVADEGMVPLARAPNLAWVRLLLDAGSPAQARPYDVLTPLGQAVATRVERSVELLLDAGAEIDRPHRYQTPLAIAAEQGSTSIVRLLLERGALVDAVDGEEGRAAILGAASHDREEVVALLLAAGARRDLGAALRAAARLGHARVVGQLARGGAPLDERDEAQQTALHHAALGDHLECLRALLKSGADVNASDGAGHTAYALAHDLGALALLREHGAQYERRPLRSARGRVAGKAAAVAATARTAAPVVGGRVQHAKFGAGQIVAVDGRGDKCKLEIRFADGVSRQLLSRFVTLVADDDPAVADTPEVREEALLAAVLAAPGDDGVRLVYADHLIERGDPRGELIVVQCQLAGLAPSDTRREALAAREADLIARHGERWLGPFGKLPLSSPGFHRGFLQQASMTGQAFVDHGAALLDAEPITRLDVSFPNGQLVPRFSATPSLARLDELRLTSSRLSAPDLTLLATSPHLRDLGGLGFVTTALDTAAAMALAAWPHRRLTRLLLRGCHLAGDVCDVLSESPHLQSLESLVIAGDLVAGGAKILVAALPRLKLLGVDEPLASHLADVAARGGFRSIRYDDLVASGVGPAAVAQVHSIDPGGTRGRRLTLWVRA